MKKFKNYVTIASYVSCVGIVILVGALLIAVFKNNLLFAGKILSYLWLWLFATGMLHVMNYSAESMVTTWIRIDTWFLTLHKRYYMYIAPFVEKKRWVFLLSIFVVCLSGFLPFYTLGGDDTRLYYLYAKEFFHFTLRVGPQTAVSSLATFLPPSSIALFAGLLLILRSLVFNLNLQQMLYTANYIGGIWGFYVLASYLFGNNNPYSKIVRLLFSCMYVFSIFIFYTLFNSQLIAIFLVSTFPFSLYLYLRGVNEKNYQYLIVAALIWTVFCYFSVSLPWFAASILVVFPIILSAFRNTFRNSIKQNIVFGILLLLFNLHWIAALPYTYAIGNASKTVSSISSQSFRSQNEQGIRSVAGMNSIFFPLLNTYHADIQKNYNWPYLPVFTKWYARILLLNAIWFPLIVFVLATYKGDKYKGLHMSVIMSFILGLYFFTAKIGNWGLGLFVWLSNTVPGFVMFRNMYDKFGFALSFAFALTLLVCIDVLVAQIKSGRTKRFLLVCMAGIIFLNVVPYLFGVFRNLPIWTTTHSFSKLEKINDDYLALTNFIQSQPSASRYAWVPLNYGNVSQIQDQYTPSFYYNGTSPFVFFSEKNDYSGMISFERFGEELADDIRNRRYTNVGKFFQKFNVGFIIVQHSVSEELQNSYLCGKELCGVQDDTYKNVLLGEKIRDFGKRYSLYGIHPAFSNEKFSVVDDFHSIQERGHVAYQRQSDRLYTVHLDHVKNNDLVVLLDPYFPQWDLVAGDRNSETNIGKHIQMYDYANAWIIDTKKIQQSKSDSYIAHSDGTISVDAIATFRLGFTYYSLVIVSIASIVAAALYVVMTIARSHIIKNYYAKNE